MSKKDEALDTLKQEKLWLIDAKRGEITYDVSNDVNDGWWHKIPHGVDRNQSDVKIKS